MATITIEDQDRGRWELSEGGAPAASRVLIVLAGAGFDPVRLVAEAARAGAVVAADGGALLCEAAGIQPDAVVGDFDSLPDAARARVDPARLHPSLDPESNDLEKAIAHVIRRWGADVEIVLAAGGGVAGGRSDHALANLGPIVAEPHAKISLVDGEGRLFALRRGVARFGGLVGRKLSVLPWTLHGVTVSETGVRYPLDRARLALGGRGVSNEITAGSTVVEVSDGVALVWIEA
jgi:thiamine pyrophosphokinase